MASWSDDYEQILLGWVFAGTTETQPGSVSLSLHSASPGDTGGNEISGGSYSRQSITFDPPTTNEVVSTNSQTFTNLPEVTLTHFGLWDDANRFIVGGELIFDQSVSSGEDVTFPVGGITVILD